MGASVITPDILQRLKAVQDAGPAPVIAANPFGPSGMNGPSPLPSIPAPVMPAAVHSQPMDDMARLNTLKSTGSGVSQIQNPWLRGLARVGDVAASFVAPNLAQLLPGTTMHHQQLLGQQEALVNQDQAQAQQEAQTANLNLQPAFKQQGLQLAQEKQNNLEQHQADLLEQQKQHQHEQYIQNLQAHGYTEDETTPGKVRPLAYAEMSQQQQAVHDLKSAQEEEQKAMAEVNKSKNDPHSAAYLQAQARINVARQNASVAAGRLGLQTQQFMMRSRGVDGQGNALPGAMIGDDGTPIGTAFQQNVRPTGTERNKGDMANSASEQLADIKAIVQKHPDMFGPGYGQASAFKQWIGSQDPDAQRFVAARTIAGDHLAGTFGGRSEAALTALDNAIGQYKDNPAAMQAGLDQLTKANSRFQNAGTVHYAGSNPSAPAAPAPTGLAVSLRDAMSLPQNRGKSESDVRADIQAHGHAVKP